MGTRDNKGERPYVLAYLKPGALYGVSDSAGTIDDARARAANRFAKRHHQNEIAKIYLHGSLVETVNAKAGV